jgi:hypothetical protein
VSSGELPLFVVEIEFNPANRVLQTIKAIAIGTASAKNTMITLKNRVFAMVELSLCLMFVRSEHLWAVHRLGRS